MYFSKLYTLYVGPLPLFVANCDVHFLLLISGFRSFTMSCLQVPIRLTHINPVSQTGSAASAAVEYEYTIRQLVRNRTIDACMSSDCPRFDLILLVRRQDGHGSSIWSGSSEETDWVHPVSFTRQGPANSVALSLPVINSATNSAVVATGRAMSPMFTNALGPDVAISAQPFTGNVVWFVDAAAASASN